MHEAMVAQKIMAAIAAEAEARNARPVWAKITCGQLHAINDELLQFAFGAISKGTRCEGVKLKIEHIPLEAKCSDCGKQTQVDSDLPACPGCGSENLKLMADAELLLEEIELVQEVDDDQG